MFRIGVKKRGNWTEAINYQRTRESWDVGEASAVFGHSRLLSLPRYPLITDLCLSRWLNPQTSLLVVPGLQVQQGGPVLNHKCQRENGVRVARGGGTVSFRRNFIAVVTDVRRRGSLMFRRPALARTIDTIIHAE